MFNHASGQLLPEHTWNPRCAQNFSWTLCSVCHQGNCCTSTREIPATWISIRTKGTERCSCHKNAALARHQHTWISLRAQGDMIRQKDCCVLTPGAQLDLFPCADRHVHATTLLRSHAVSTLGSHSVRK